MERADILIVGAGAVGLAVVSEVSRNRKGVVVIERHPAFGQESSSRNSEVIHAGLYYSKDSFKTRFCVEGNRLLYEFCKKHNIAHKKLGKLIVATKKEEIKDLEKLIKQGEDNGVEGLKLLTKEEAKKMEPNIEALCALYSPYTGIVDTHQLMKHLESLAKDNKTVFAYNCEVTGIEKRKDGYSVDIRDADGEKLCLFSRVIINSAGLNSDKIAQMVGINIEEAGYKLRYSKGEYFRLSSNKSRFINRLIYPTPKEDSLGIHTVADLQGQLKLGPNAFYVDEINYNVDESHVSEFYEAVKRFLPFIERQDLSPDMAGIRPKLRKADFIIADEKEKGLPGFINLIGIESPGLTASMAIAKYVNAML